MRINIDGVTDPRHAAMLAVLLRDGAPLLYRAVLTEPDAITEDGRVDWLHVTLRARELGGARPERWLLSAAYSLCSDERPTPYSNRPAYFLGDLYRSLHELGLRDTWDEIVRVWLAAAPADSVAALASVA